MSKVSKEIEDFLLHIGTERHSGRFPWGSGKEPYQHSGDFLSRVESLKKEGKTETEIAEMMGLKSGQLRTQKSLASDERKNLLRETARALRDDGLSYAQIAEKIGKKNESSVRSLLNEDSISRMKRAQEKADYLKKIVDEKGMVDVGAGAERYLDCSKELLGKSLYILDREGYPTYKGGIPTGPNKQTNQAVLCPPGTEHSAIYDYSKINSLSDYVFREGVENPAIFRYPKSMDSKRIMVRYAEDGGVDKDGLIELRRGVDDLSLGKSHYAQVRILIDDQKFAKGMAIYSDEVPSGYDMVFNTNKKKDVPKLEVFKNLQNDPENPFGSRIKVNGQSDYIDKDGKKQLSLINKRAEEGDWNEWKDRLPAQFLSKQPRAMIEKQLRLAIEDKELEFKEIMALENPTVKKALLETFANNCDSSAVHLDAAALPRQKYRVLIPVPSLKDTEVYAPTFNDGEQVALVRFPHGGTFEIPVLTVNNKHPKARQLLENAQDAIGINSKVAERLSGADFDGDAVLTIPTERINSKLVEKLSGESSKSNAALDLPSGKTNKTQVFSSPPLRGLEGFNAKDEYGEVPGMRYMKRTVEGAYGDKKIDNTQLEMGKISNLITDMTLIGAPNSEITKAVRHSMVVIDASKHNLNYKKSESDNQIALLKKRYQSTIDPITGKTHTSAATLLSRASSETQIPKRVGSEKINKIGAKWYDPSKPEGAKIYTEVSDGYVDKNGRKHSSTYKVYKVVKDANGVPLIDPVTHKVVKVDTGKVKSRKQKISQMENVDDARKLSSGTVQEEIYANYANKMKAMANASRKEMVYTGKIKYDSKAKEKYQKEVDRLSAAVALAEKNKPRERDAQRITNANIKAKKEENPGMSKEDIKKHTQIELERARIRVGAKRENIEISDREWEAIQAGALSEERLKKVIANTDIDKLRARATPRQTTTLSTFKINKIEAMQASGYNTADIARALGVSSSTVSKYLK